MSDSTIVQDYLSNSCSQILNQYKEMEPNLAKDSAQAEFLIMIERFMHVFDTDLTSRYEIKDLADELKKIVGSIKIVTQTKKDKSRVASSVAAEDLALLKDFGEFKQTVEKIRGQALRIEAKKKRYLMMVRL